MKKNKNEAKRLSLSKETLAILDLRNVEGGIAAIGCGRAGSSAASSTPA